MKKNKEIYYQCTWRLCKAIIPESDPTIQGQKRNGTIYCPECGSPMMRRRAKSTNAG